MDKEVHELVVLIAKRVAQIKVMDEVAISKPSVAEGHILDTYNEFRTPGSVILAQLHGRANSAGNSHHLMRRSKTIDPRSSIDPVISNLVASRICPCCMLGEREGEIPVGISTIRLGKLGPAIPAFFEFAVFSTIAMAISFCLYSIYNLIVFARDNWCGYDPAPGTQHVKYCGSAWKFYFSQANKKEFEIDWIERLLFFLNWLILLIFKNYFVRRLVNLDKKLDEHLTEVTDYTVEIRGLPERLHALDLFHVFSGKLLFSPELGRTVEINPKAANFVFSDAELIINQDVAIRRSLKKYGKFKTEGKNDLKEEQKQKFYERTLELERNLELRCTMPLNEDESYIHPSINFCGKVFLSFETMIQKNAVIYQMEMSGLAKTCYEYLGAIPSWISALGIGNQQSSDQGMQFYVLKSKNPADVIWENQGIGALNHTMRGLVSIFITTLIFGAALGAAIGLKAWQSSVTNNAIASIVLTLVIKIFSALFGEATKYMIRFERPETRTQLHVLTFWRMSLFSFFNSTVLLIILNRIRWGKDLVDNMWSDSGLGNDLWYMLIFTILDPLTALFDFGYFIKLYKRWSVQKNPNQLYTQKEMNLLFEGPEFSISGRISKYCRSMMLALCLLALFPLSALISILCTIAFFWIDKFFLLRWARLPDYCSAELGFALLKFFDVILIIYAGSYLVFDYIFLPAGIHWTSIVVFVLSILVYLFNLQYFVRHSSDVQNKEALMKQGTFNDVYSSFGTSTYKDKNPIDIVKENLQVYKKPETLKIQADLETLAEKELIEIIKGADNFKTCGNPFLQSQLIEMESEDTNKQEGVPLLRDEVYTPYNFPGSARTEILGNPTFKFSTPLQSQGPKNPHALEFRPENPTQGNQGRVNSSPLMRRLHLN